jgi:septal ring factor EnvC (AmiA/AmiB activator)
MLTSIRDRIDQLERHIERATGKLDIQRAWRAELGERADAVTRQIAAADARIEQREFELRQAREILANQHERLREMGYGSSGTLPQ